MSSPAAPLVSVIVPAFDAAATLAETLASAAAQSCREIEIVIVDDGSRDDTAGLAEAFCARDPRARLLRQANRGASAARNAGIAAARGEFVAPLDADDIWHPDKLARQLSALAAGAGFAYCWMRDIDMDDFVWRDGPRPNHAGAVYLRMLADNFVGNGSALLVRRAAALAVGGYEESLHGRGGEGSEDMLFQLRLAEHCAAAVAPAYLVGYRRRAGARSDNPAAMFGSWLGVRHQLEVGEADARRADRTGLARRRLVLAEGLARRGVWGRALVQGGAALRGDPARTAIALAARIERWLGKRPTPPMVRFVDLDPETPAWPEPMGRLGRSLAALEARRGARLMAR